MKMLVVHREGVVWFLKNRLEKASEEQRVRQEIRLQRRLRGGRVYCIRHWWGWGKLWG
jgi:hypothetical protein